MLFRDFASTAEAIAAAAPAGKIPLVAGMLRSIRDERELYTVVVWLAHGPFPPMGERKLSIGGTLLRQAYALYAGDESSLSGTLDHEMFAAARTFAGSTAETIRMLVEARRRAGIEEERFEGLGVLQVQSIYEHLATTRATAARAAMLVDTWRMMSALEIGFFLNIVDRIAMQSVLSQPMLEQGIALAFGGPPEAVRYAAMIEGDVGRTALHARNGELHRAEIRPFRPIDFMLASPLDREIDPEGDLRFTRDPAVVLDHYLCEDMLEGARAQAHIRDDAGARRVAIFSRDGGELSETLPDVVMQLENLPHGTILDGELVAVTSEGEIAHIDNLHQRLGARKPDRRLISTLPIRFISHDLLLAEGIPLLAEPIEERRRRLIDLARLHRLPITEQRAISGWNDLEEQLAQASERGSKGIILKRRGSAYDYGHRGTSWLKGRKETGTIDVVIRYATGLEGRNGTLGDFTLGVWLDEPGGSRRLVNIGRIDGSCAEEDLPELNRRLPSLLGKRFGTTYEVAPAIVCQVAYHSIHRSPRTEAGFVLRLPHIRRIRWDRRAEQIATVAEVEHRFTQGLLRNASPAAGAVDIPSPPEEGD